MVEIEPQVPAKKKQSTGSNAVMRVIGLKHK
jgi:hypothetical protein